MKPFPVGARCSTLLAMLATAGCAEAQELVAAPEDWAVLTPDRDPWPGGDTQPPCPPRAGQLEEGFFEIDLKECGWVTAEAQSRASIAQGQLLTTLIFHTALVADSPGSATLGLMADGEELWRLEVPIPSPTDFHEVEIRLAAPLRQGSALHWHVHNHGANSYRIGAVRASSPR